MSREELLALAEALEGVIPANVAIHNPRWPDSTVLPVDVTLGELRKVSRLAASLRSRAAMGEKA